MIFNNSIQLVIPFYHRVSNQPIFDAYFSCKEHDEKYLYSTLKTILYNQDDETVISEIVNINNCGAFNSFLSDLSKYVAGASTYYKLLNNNKLQHLLLLIARLMHKLKIECNWFCTDTYDDFCSCVINLLNTLHSEAKYTDFMLSLFNDEQVTPVPLAYIYNNYCHINVIKNITTDKDQLEQKLQQIFISKSMAALKSDNALTYNNLYFIEIIFRKFTDYRLQVKTLLSNLIQSNDFALAKIISLNLQEGRDSRNAPYWFLSDSILDIDRELAYSRINKFLSSEQFNKLEGLFQEKAIAYLMLSEKIKATPPESKEKVTANSSEDKVIVTVDEVQLRMQELGIL